MEPRKKRVSCSGRVCSVNGCSNSEHRNRYLTFYSFPSRNYEVERKKRWIEAVRQTKKDETWMPNSSSRICSIHFLGGKKSDIAAHESYVPSIFYGTPSWAKVSNVYATTRTVSSGVGASLVTHAHEEFDQQCSSMVVHDQIQPKTVSITCQTEYWINDDPSGPNTLFCWTGQNEASTQTHIFVGPKLQPNTAMKIEQKSIACGTDIILEPKPQQNTLQQIKKKNVACGTDVEMNPGFLGVASITSDETMRYLAGMCQVAFHSFLELIVPGKYGQPMYYKKVSKENRLLLFFMKIKLGLAFTALGSFFCIHRTTATHIFFEVLKTLVEQTKMRIIWPSKESVRKKLPLSFHNYPTCRCIIDCTEIPIETPSTLEQRILMYSNSIGGFTAKFFIAITPDGLICKISKGYGGRATDGFITNDCGFLNLIEKGDVVLAGKGFPQIKSELAKHNCTLVTPPFALNPQFSAKEVDEDYKIASLKIYVDKALQRVKLSGILKNITADLLPYIDGIMHVCCVIANIQPSVIKDSD